VESRGERLERYGGRKASRDTHRQWRGCPRGTASADQNETNQRERKALKLGNGVSSRASTDVASVPTFAVFSRQIRSSGSIKSECSFTLLQRDH
jgi:hypothetical protein